LAETSKVTDDGLAHLARGVRMAATLTSLDLHECREVTSAGLCCLQSLTALRCLDVSDMKRVDADGVAALAALPWLAELRMCGSHAVAAGEGALDSLMSSAERLERMDLEWCFAMGERETQALAATPSPLAQLSFKGCGALVDAAVLPLATISSLGAVDLTWCSQVAAPLSLVLASPRLHCRRPQWDKPRAVHRTETLAQQKRRAIARELVKPINRRKIDSQRRSWFCERALQSFCSPHAQ
jgi:hypothetical protein